MEFYELLSLSHYRRENLFLKALIVLAIIGAIFLTWGLSRADAADAAAVAAVDGPPLETEGRGRLDEELWEEEEEWLESK